MCPRTCNILTCQSSTSDYHNYKNKNTVNSKDVKHLLEFSSSLNTVQSIMGTIKFPEQLQIFRRQGACPPNGWKNPKITCPTHKKDGTSNKNRL